MSSNASRAITQFWAEYAGTELPTVDDWHKVAECDAADHKVDQLDAWTEIFDQILSWAIAHNFALQLTMTAGNGITEINKCRMSIGASIISLSLSVRRLCLDGFDFPARQVVRCLREYIDVLSLLNLNTDLCGDFINGQDEISANKFWHKHISKGKAIKSINNNRRVIVGDNIISAIEQWRSQEDKMMAMASHPSYLSGITTLIPTFHRDPDSLHTFTGFLGVKSTLCIRPLRYATIALTEFFIQSEIPEIPKETEEEPFISSIMCGLRSGQKVLPKIIDYAIHNQDSSDFGLPTIS